jgi:hypothetical protein
VKLSYELTNDERAPASARRAVERDIGEMVERTVLASLCVVVSEVVTCGVHAGSAEPIGLSLRLDDDGCVRGEIRVPGLDADCGGNLGVLDGLTHDWGIEPEASRMWFEVAAGPVAPTG